MRNKQGTGGLTNLTQYDENTFEPLKITGFHFRRKLYGQGIIKRISVERLQDSMWLNRRRQTFKKGDNFGR